jgi:hypothetical protein
MAIHLDSIVKDLRGQHKDALLAEVVLVSGPS